MANLEKSAAKAEKEVKTEVKNISKKVTETAKKVTDNAKKVTDSAKKAAKTVNHTSSSNEVYVQYYGAEVAVSQLVEAAKADFKANNPKVAIHSLKLYIKPEDHAAYYVVNSKVDGKVDF